MECLAFGSATPPEQGWTVWSGKEDIPDASLKFSTAAYSWCPHLTVTATGAAAREQAQCLDMYKATPMTSCGRKVRGIRILVQLINVLFGVS